MFYTYRQNNSGGEFDHDEASGIGINVIVEADNPKQADERAKRIGLYFDGCDSGRDCSCCGDRWYQLENYYSDSGKEVPSIYDETMEQARLDSFGWWGIASYVHYSDGRIQQWWHIKDRPGWSPPTEVVINTGLGVEV